MKTVPGCVLSALLICLCACTQTPTVSITPSETATVTAEVTLQTEPISAPPVAEVIANLEGLPLEEFIEESYLQLRLRDPDGMVQFTVCFAERTTGPTDPSGKYRQETMQLESAILAQLRAYPPEEIPEELRLSYDVYEWYLDDLVRGQAFVLADLPVNGYGLWDQVNTLIDATLNLPVEDGQAAGEYVYRLAQTGTWVDMLLVGLAAREQAGVIPPVFLLESALMQIDAYMGASAPGMYDMDAIELYTTFAEKLNAITELSEDEKDALLSEARNEIEQTFLPAFERLRAYLADLANRAPEEAGLARQPGGEAYYAWLLRRYTGSDLTAAEIHQIGLEWVAELQANMRQSAAALGYPPDIGMAELNALIDEHSIILEGDALLTEYERLLTDAKAAASDAFDIFPSTDVVITYDPAAPVPGFYQLPALDGSDPGQMIVNLQSPHSGPLLYNEISLLSHETIPGHHVQIALVLDLDLPVFRNPFCTDVYYREIEFQGYSEGWAVYAEQLGMEMGLYGGDSWKLLGTQLLLLNQAARMVVDTGIHGLSWTRAEAAAYFEEATGRPTQPGQMNRFVALPGQAVSYDFGAYTILHLREQAMDALGAQFDLGAFHDQILGSGPVPVGFLEGIIEDWIATNR